MPLCGSRTAIEKIFLKMSERSVIDSAISHTTDANVEENSWIL
jgi:hypothetical protein